MTGPIVVDQQDLLDQLDEFQFQTAQRDTTPVKSPVFKTPSKRNHLLAAPSPSRPVSRTPLRRHLYHEDDGSAAVTPSKYSPFLTPAKYKQSYTPPTARKNPSGDDGCKTPSTKGDVPVSPSKKPFLVVTPFKNSPFMTPAKYSQESDISTPPSNALRVVTDACSTPRYAHWKLKCCAHMAHCILTKKSLIAFSIQLILEE